MRMVPVGVEADTGRLHPALARAVAEQRRAQRGKRGRSVSHRLSRRGGNAVDAYGDRHLVRLGGGHPRTDDGDRRRVAHASWTTARAFASTLLSPTRASRSTATRLPSSFSATVPLTSRVAPWSSSGTATGDENRTPYSTTAPGSPAQSVTTRPASAIVNMPWAMTLGSPTEVATRSFQWMTLKSPEAPQYWMRLTRCTWNVCAGIAVPTS